VRNALRTKEIERIKTPRKRGFSVDARGTPGLGLSRLITQAQNNFALGMVLVLKKMNKIKRKCCAPFSLCYSLNRQFETSTIQIK
jgi:hypothetical protein